MPDTEPKNAVTFHITRLNNILL